MDRDCTIVVDNVLHRCTAQELVMVGDRCFTDVVFGNRHGMLTICPEPITLDGEPQV